VDHGWAAELFEGILADDFLAAVLSGKVEGASAQNTLLLQVSR